MVISLDYTCANAYRLYLNRVIYLEINEKRGYMSDYAKVNLLEIENSASTEGMQAYFGRKHLDTSELGVSLFRYAPNFQAKNGHSHKVQEEAYLVANGSGRILLGDEVMELKQWDVARVAPEVVRAFAAGPDGLDFGAVGGTKPAEGDGVRQEITWPE
jgi:quercetin dioxygenase-like cupin family protein